MKFTVASLPVRKVVIKIAASRFGIVVTGAMLFSVALFVSVAPPGQAKTESGMKSQLSAKSAPGTKSQLGTKTKPSTKKVSGSFTGAKVKVWRLVQRNAKGKSVMLVGDSCFKYIFVDQSVSWIAKAPNYNICIINTEKHIGQLRPFGFAVSRQDNSVEYGQSDRFTKKSQLFFSRPALKITYDVTSSDPLKEKVEMMYQTGSQRASSFSKVEQIYSDWFKISPQVQHVLNGMTRVSKSNGVMLEETHFYPGGRKHVVLTTESVSQCEVPVSEFDYPTNFKQASFKDINQEDEKARAMTGVFEDLLFDPATPSGNKTPPAKVPKNK
ncbi:MAG: hypothetical protein SGJ27_03095 [Candidatus Melainabacteria bacterium]|nr:hypothetical protein [Candidatus Melainabacteria bacterium]